VTTIYSLIFTFSVQKFILQSERFTR
jgi:hypothetical protein